MGDFDDFLTIELKSEMAHRYFSFRKLIEDDSLDYNEKLERYAFILEKRISFDLIRIYILLRDDELIDDFLSLCRLEKKMFYDPYLVESETIRKRVFESIRMRGLTRQGRYQNFLIDCYDRLWFHVELYRKRYEELEEIRDGIVEEIHFFENRHDISAMLRFLHSLGAQPVAGHFEQGLEPEVSRAIAAKMKIAPPEEVACHLPVLPMLPACQDIKTELLALAEQAYGLQRETFLVIFANKFFKPRP